MDFQMNQSKVSSIFDIQSWISTMVDIAERFGTDPLNQILGFFLLRTATVTSPVLF
jgi:hypothetical protein